MEGEVRPPTLGRSVPASTTAEIHDAEQHHQTRQEGKQQLQKQQQQQQQQLLRQQHLQHPVMNPMQVCSVTRQEEYFACFDV